MGSNYRGVVQYRIFGTLCQSSPYASEAPEGGVEIVFSMQFDWAKKQEYDSHKSLTPLLLFCPTVGEFSMIRIVVIAVLVLAVDPLVAGQKQSARRTQTERVIEAIRKVDNERIQAQIHADVVVLNRIYSDDFIGVGPSGTVRTKPQVIADFTSGDLKFQSITTDEVQIRVYVNTAVETGQSAMIGQDKGKPVPRDNRFTRVWVRQQGRWRLVLNHYSTLITQR